MSNLTYPKTWFRLDSPEDRTRELFPTMAGGVFCIRVIRTLYPHLNDHVLAACLGMDPRGFATFIPLDGDWLGGDPDPDVLDGLVMAATLAGKPEDVEADMNAAAAATRLYAKNPTACRDAVLFVPATNNAETLPDTCRDIPDEDFAAIHTRPVAAARMAGALPGFMGFAHGDASDILFALDAISYMAWRAAFDRELLRLVHCRIDGGPGNAVRDGFWDGMGFRPDGETKPGHPEDQMVRICRHMAKRRIP